MKNRRQEKVASLLQETLASQLLFKAQELAGPGVLVSVVSCKVTPDLAEARFYLSIFNHDKPNQVVDVFNENSSTIRRDLGNELRHHLRKIPEIVFFYDDSIEYADKMNELFKKLKKDED